MLPQRHSIRLDAADLIAAPSAAQRLGSNDGSPPRQARRLIRPALIALLSVVAVPNACLAQSRDSREVLMGTFGRGPTEAPPGHDGTPRTGPPGRSQESEAHRLLEDARDDLADGNRMGARRQFEVLVQRYPETAAADEARRELAQLYAAAPRPASTDAAREPLARRTPPGRDDRPQPPAGAPGQPDRSTAWSTEVRRVRALDNDFRTIAGDRVFFGDASSDLGARARAVLLAQAQWLIRHPGLPVTIEAHADDGGSREFNHDLARRRAEAVRVRLIEEGVTPDRIRMQSHGRERRLALCPEAECAAQNRRVITMIGPTESESGDGAQAPPIGQPQTLPVPIRR